ncbi:hypothetical protein PMIT1327_00616 [Prochlorococcus marinus str. MIT 1327]|nr:hypothetical protein PMIT1312_00778 [Prochlorococcus marinus str. MIT 1312]KZR83229.1 hypothetical protein PMIT1327_00616 [Prochlorococcus marinus str. MIT 1327]
MLSCLKLDRLHLTLVALTTKHDFVPVIYPVTSLNDALSLLPSSNFIVDNAKSCLVINYRVYFSCRIVNHSISALH